jgi:hypothetical protein
MLERYEHLNHNSSLLAGDSHWKKEARRCKPGSVRFELIVPFSLDPLSFVLSFSF